MHAQHGEFVSHAKAKKDKKNTFLSSNPQFFGLVFFFCAVLVMYSSWTRNVTERFCWQPWKRVRVCKKKNKQKTKKTVAGSARFLKQPTYEMFSIKVHDSVLSENECRCQGGFRTTAGQSYCFCLWFLFVKKIVFASLVLKAPSLSIL